MFNLQNRNLWLDRQNVETNREKIEQEKKVKKRTGDKKDDLYEIKIHQLNETSGQYLTLFP